MVLIRRIGIFIGLALIALPVFGQVELVRPADFRYFVTVGEDTVASRSLDYKAVQDALAYKYQFPDSTITLHPLGIEFRGTFPVVRDTVYTKTVEYIDAPDLIQNVDWQHRQSAPDEHVIELEITHDEDIEPSAWIEACGERWAVGAVIPCNEMARITVEATKDARTVTVRDSVNLKLMNDFFLSETIMPFSDAVFAYSIYKLPDYSGNCMRIRRSSDDAEQDIGFDATGRLDKSAIDSFIGAGDGFVVTWYDQSGNGHDITQSTNASQPQINLKDYDGTYILSFDGVDDFLQQDTSPARGNQMNYLEFRHFAGDFKYVYDNGYRINRNSLRIRSNDDFEYTDTGIRVADIIPSNEYALWTNLIVSGSDADTIPYQAWKDGVEQFSELGTNGGRRSGITIGARAAQPYGWIEMDMSTFVGYSGLHESTKRQSVEQAINNLGATTVEASYSVATSREITKESDYSTQTGRSVQSGADYSPQTDRTLNSEASNSASTERKITTLAGYTAASLRKVKALALYSAATLRELISEAQASYSGATRRRVTKDDSYSASTDRKVTTGASYSPATDRNVIKSASYSPETIRSLIKAGSYSVATERKVTDIAGQSPSTFRKVNKRASASGVTLRMLTKAAQYSGATLRTIRDATFVEFPAVVSTSFRFLKSSTSAVIHKFKTKVTK